MNSRLPFVLLLISSFLPFCVFAAVPKAQPAETPVPSPTPVPTTVPVSQPAPAAANVSKALVIHKPLVHPSWGKIVQYRREQNFSLVDKSWETLHEFVLQDANDVVRIATYHESASGDGYWEIWVWDRP